MDYDVIIVGSGPAGSSTALFLAKKGYKPIVIDKAKFPRDKVCGDGLSGKTIKLLKEIGIENLDKRIARFADGVIFSSPDGTLLEVEIPKEKLAYVHGYISKREDFDNVLFNKVKEKCAFIEEAQVIDVIKNNDQVIGVKVKTKDGIKEIKANVVVGADGAGSTIAAKVNAEPLDDEHHVIALRQYWQGVEDLEDKIELHFMDDIIPGYFWIFPLPNKMANVGIGMITKDIKKRKIDLKAALNKAINNKIVAHRFKNAKPLENPVGWGLPLGSKRRKGCGNGYWRGSWECIIIWKVSKHCY